MEIPCDVCGDLVEDDVAAWQIHNQANYERHVRLAHPPDDADRIIKEYYERFPCENS